MQSRWKWSCWLVWKDLQVTISFSHVQNMAKANGLMTTATRWSSGKRNLSTLNLNYFLYARKLRRRSKQGCFRQSVCWFLFAFCLPIRSIVSAAGKCTALITISRAGSYAVSGKGWKLNISDFCHENCLSSDVEVDFLDCSCLQQWAAHHILRRRFAK